MKTLLSELIRKQTGASLLGVFSRTTDKIAEDLAQEVLRDPDVREEMRTLVREAFTAALAELRQPAPDEEAEDLRTRMRHLEQRVSEQISAIARLEPRKGQS
jgi:hypothetical protein